MWPARPPSSPRPPTTDLVIWGHARIERNLARAATEISAAYSRGIVHQFGIVLPPEGPDAVVNVGLGRAFRNPSHAPYTPGFVAPTNTLTGPTSATIAGLPVEMTPAPSDADDSITIWFPTLGVAVNNLVWPALFNVFAIRGEEYRDPRVLLGGLDHLLALGAEHLVGAHGRPFSGADEIRDSITLYRDSIQFLWDQTVRGLNRGLTSGELTEFVELPACFGEQSITRQYYGVVEHHVRQIRNGLVGWFDGDESQLFPLAPIERNQRLIAGFGGRAQVQAQAEAALAGNDLRWALELATWLVAVRRRSRRSSRWWIGRRASLAGRRAAHDRTANHRSEHPQLVPDPRPRARRSRRPDPIPHPSIQCWRSRQRRSCDVHPCPAGDARSDAGW